MPLATIVVYFVDRKIRSPPVAFKYAPAAAIVLLGIFILREPVTARKAIGLVSALASLGALAGS